MKVGTFNKLTRIENILTLITVILLAIGIILCAINTLEIQNKDIINTLALIALVGAIGPAMASYIISTVRHLYADILVYEKTKLPNETTE